MKAVFPVSMIIEVSPYEGSLRLTHNTPFERAVKIRDGQ
jgi:hypothetical protein